MLHASLAAHKRKIRDGHTICSRGKKILCRVAPERAWERSNRRSAILLPLSPTLPIFCFSSITISDSVYTLSWEGKHSTQENTNSRRQATVRQCRTLLRLRRTPPSPLSLDFGNPDTIVTTATLLACYRMWIVFVWKVYTRARASTSYFRSSVSSVYVLRTT